MNILEIPYTKYTSIEKTDYNDLFLSPKKDLLNHLDSIHAGAQFVLAETKSAFYLKRLFTNLEHKIVPILRNSCIKYTKPAMKKIFAYAKTTKEEIDKFTKQFELKGRSTIEIFVEIKDIDDQLISKSSFTWFIQTINKS
jgi:acyl-coenzyme A thioesterase PaaI-like protein